MAKDKEPKELERQSTDFVPQKNLPEEGQDSIVVGHVYKEENGLQEVIPYFVDFAAAKVNFAPVGRSAEDIMRTSDFLNRFKYVGPQPSTSEEVISKEESQKNIAARRKELDENPNRGF